MATREQIQTQFDVNVFGMMETTKAILPYFREQGGGTIINLSSQGGRSDGEYMDWMNERYRSAGLL